MIWSGWWKVYAASSNNSRKQEVSNYSHCAPCSMVIYKIFSIWSQYSISQCNEFNVRYFVTKIGHPASFEGSTPKTSNDMQWPGVEIRRVASLEPEFIFMLCALYGYVAAPCCSFSIGKLRWPDNCVVRRKLINPYLSMCEPSTFFLSLAYLGAEISCGHAHCHESAVFHLSKASLES